MIGKWTDMTIVAEAGPELTAREMAVLRALATGWFTFRFGPVEWIWRRLTYARPL